MEYKITSFKEASEYYGIDKDLYNRILKLATSSSAHPVVYEEGGRRFTVADLVMGSGSLKGGPRPNLSKAKPVSLADSEKWINKG